MIHMDAMLDSFSKTMSRSGLMSTFNSTHKSGGNVSSSGGSSTLSRSSLGSNMSGNKNFSARIVFLDDTCQTFDVDKRAKGQFLIDTVFRHLDLGEKEYFGLMFNDTGADNVPNGHAPDIMRWLDPNKLVRKQVRIIGGQKAGMTPVATLYFRVKFYVTDPSRLKEEFTRYQVYMQVKKDITEGRLNAPLSTICLLSSYVVQSTLGDFDQMDCAPGYLTQFYDLRKHSQNSDDDIPDDEMDRRITELHKLHKNQSPGEAEMNFLEHAKRLEMYGIALHPGKDSHGRAIQLGVTCIGLVVFQNSIKINTFSWSKIVKISFKRKQFFIQLRKELTESYDTLLGFNLANYRSCKNLWKSAVEHHSFFRLHAPPHSVQQRGRSATPPSSNGAKKFLTLSLGSKFRYSGRNEFKTTPEKKETKEFSRLSTFRKTLPLHLEPVQPSNPNNTEDQKSGTSRSVARLASPETSSIGSSVHSHNGGLKPKPNTTTPISTGPPKRGQKEETSSHSSQKSLANRAIESFNNKVQSLSSKLPKKAWQEDPTSDDEGGFLESRPINSLNKVTNKRKSATNMFTSTVASSTPPPPNLSNHTSICLSSDSPAASDRTNNSSNHSGFKGSGSIQSNGVLKLTPVSLKLPIGPAHQGAHTLQNEGGAGSSAHNSPLNGRHVAQLQKGGHAQHGPAHPTDGEDPNNGLVIITIYPDEQGRFGFNVKGGIDQKMPIIVSRVGANTPADKCYPRLNEGDQVVLINGRDISQHTHDQVVNFIRASSEPHSKKLILAVRQNVYMGEDVEEPEFQYVPDTPHVSPLVPGTQALSQSMLLLEESLESGAIVGQFEQLYRRNTSLAMSICHTTENASKNRYRDISPYDSTRVILSECPGGDYINANHVVMTIPGSGIINRYIATQGPLATTCIDFWYMTWECQSTLIIMLTTIVERGRIKCHKYWPDVGDTIDYGTLSVTCITEDTTENFVFREFSIQHKETQEVRQVTQMAYLSWPDHGVPQSSNEFVEFVEAVRSRRKGSMEPTIVHCSAGIGRTGVVILMETALYLIEANQPVYPLDLTRVMRDQRASMIQTPSQYKFVCQAILKVYKEGLVKPLPEFCQNTSASEGKKAS